MDLDNVQDTGPERSLTKSVNARSSLSSSLSKSKNSSPIKKKSEKAASTTSSGTSAPRRSRTFRSLISASQESISKWLVPRGTLSTTASKRKADVPVETLNDLSYAHPLTETWEAGVVPTSDYLDESTTELVSSTLSLSSQESLSLSEMRSSGQSLDVDPPLF